MEILIGCRDKEKAAKYFKNITKNMFFFFFFIKKNRIRNERVIVNERVYVDGWLATRSSTLELDHSSFA